MERELLPHIVISFSFLTRVIYNSSLSKLILISFHFNGVVGNSQTTQADLIEIARNTKVHINLSSATVSWP